MSGLLLAQATVLFAQSTNLIPDASFEAPLPPVFDPGPQPTCHIEKRLAATADHGRFVLAIAGWDQAGSTVRSPVIELDAALVSAGLSVRSFAAQPAGTIELVLLDEAGKRRAVFGTATLDGRDTWTRLERSAVALEPPLPRGRLAIVVRGPQRGARVEIDRIGLFRGDRLGAADGPFDFTWFEAEDFADGAAWKVADEPGGPTFDHLRRCPVCRQAFVARLQRDGVTLPKLGVASWDEVVIVPPAERTAHPELSYHSALFRLQSAAARTRAVADAKRRFLPDTARTYVNLVPIYSEALTFADRGTDPFLLQREGGLELGWMEDWLGYGVHPRQAATQLAMVRAAAGTRQPLGMYVIGESGPAQTLRLKYYLAVAQGARHLNVYNYGPWYAGIDAWSEELNLYPLIADVQHELAAIDDALAGTTRRPTAVAILYNRTASIWDVDDGAAENDAGYLHWVLAHGGFDADFVSEDDLEAGALDRYRVLYATGPQLRRATADRLAAWVRGGGTLYGTAGAGSRDQYDRPLATLDAVFGARSVGLTKESPLGRPRFEMRTQKPLDELTGLPGTGLPPVTFSQLCYRETLEPLPGAKIILTNRAGRAATRPWTADAILELGRAYQPAAVLAAAADLDLFSALAPAPRTAAELATQLPADPRGLTALLDALAALGLLEKEADRYRVPREVAVLLGQHGDGSVLAMAQHQANCLRRWAQLAPVVQTGQPAQRLPSVRGAQADLASFIGAMHNIAAPQADDLISCLAPLQFQHLLDVGGASGTWTMAFLRACPTGRATLFDLPDVIPLARARLATAGLVERVALLAGDFQQDPLPAGTDLAWISAIVHQNSRAQNRTLFGKTHAALVPGGRIAIRDLIMEESRTKPVAGALFALNMLVGTEAGGTFTLAELRADLEAAGFRGVTTARNDGTMNAVVVATKS